LALLSGDQPPDADRLTDRDSTGGDRVLATVGIVVGILGIVFSGLFAVASLAVAMLTIGLVLGFLGGILLSPPVRRGAAWLQRYLEGP
jgi:hypothetical protein